MNFKAIIVGLHLFLISCGPGIANKHEQPVSETSFAVNQQWTGNSVLRTISATAGLEICVAYQDRSPDSQLQAEVRNAAIQAVQGWNGLLVGMNNPQWNVSYPNIRFVFDGYGTCSNYAGSVVKINIWQQESIWTQKFGTQRSHARPSERTFNISPTSLNVLAYVVTHEYGHLIGMGDTYQIDGQLEPHNQPPSMMQVHNHPFVQDDITGVRAIWRFIKTGTFSCGEGYRTGSAGANTFNYAFCIPN